MDFVFRIGYVTDVHKIQYSVSASGKLINFWIYYQISALQKRIGSIIENAGKAGVNIVCLQEAWSKIFRK